MQSAIIIIYYYSVHATLILLILIEYDTFSPPIFTLVASHVTLDPSIIVL